MLGARIAALRRNQGLSQAELARRLQISPSAVGMYEQGRREPSGALLVSIAGEFGVATDYLLTGKPTQPEDSAALAQMLESLVDLADLRLENRKDRPFTRQQLALLFAAMLTEP